MTDPPRSSASSEAPGLFVERCALAFDGRRHLPIPGTHFRIHEAWLKTQPCVHSCTKALRYRRSRRQPNPGRWVQEDSRPVQLGLWVWSDRGDPNSHPPASLQPVPQGLYR